MQIKRAFVIFSAALFCTTSFTAEDEAGNGPKNQGRGSLAMDTLMDQSVENESIRIKADEVFQTVLGEEAGGQLKRFSKSVIDGFLVREEKNFDPESLAKAFGKEKIFKANAQPLFARRTYLFILPAHNSSIIDIQKVKEEEEKRMLESWTEDRLVKKLLPENLGSY